MSVIQLIADFLGQVAAKLGAVEQKGHEMSSTLQTILAKLDDQNRQISALVAQRDASEQADLDKISAAIDANGAVMAKALGTAASAETGSASFSATSTADAAAGASTLMLTAGSPISDGASIVGVGIASGTTLKVQDGASGTTILSVPTTAAIPSGTSFTVTNPQT